MYTVHRDRCLNKTVRLDFIKIMVHIYLVLQDVMEDEEMKFGPNGGLIFSMEFLMENTDWLEVS